MLRYWLEASCLVLCLGLIGCSDKSGSNSTASPSADSSSKKVAGNAATADETAPNSSSTAGQKPNAKKTIGLSILTSTNPFFVEIGESMRAAAVKQGYDVVVVSGDLDPNKQQNQVKDFIVQRVAAIVLTPCDSKAIGTSIQEANAAGIPVFTADIACIAENANVVTHVATDNYNGGRQAAVAMIEALNGKGKVAILDFPQIESVMLRTKGFRDELAEQTKNKGVSIEIVSVLAGDGDKERSYKATQDLLQSHPDLNGIFAINDPSALGCHAALENASATERVKIVGFDGQIDGKRAIRDGKIYADPIQFPKKIGEQTVDSIFKYLEGENVPKEQLIPTALYRQSDAAKDTEL